MALSNELISQFVKATRDETNIRSETTVYGTIVEYNGEKYMQLDGSELLTPISSTTNVEDGERVTGTIKDHTLLVTGNLSSPSARTDDVSRVETKVDDIGSEIDEFDIILADKVDTKELNAVNGRVDNLVSDNILIREQLTVKNAEIDNLVTDNVLIRESLTVQSADIVDLKAKDAEVDGKLTARDADIASLQADNVLIRESLTVQSADIVDLKAKDAEITGKLSAQDADISGKLSAKDAEILYATIDFANIDMAAVEKLFSESGIIKNLVVKDGSITGELVGVTIKGDLIEGNTIVAEKLVVKGSDGLYYKLNTDGVTTEGEQTEYNSLNGSVIAAKTITAEKISVSDLVAFGATIGGFHITNDSIFSGTKASADTVTPGIYLGADGQIAFGDSTNYVRFFTDSDGVSKLQICTDSLTLSGTGKTVEETIEEVRDSVSSLRLDANDITASVFAIETAINGLSESTVKDIQTLTEKVEAKMTSTEVDIQIKSALDNGVDKVVTSTGYTLNSEGLTINKSGSEMSTIITEDGMRVDKNGSEVLSANHTGVDAVNLHAKTYLIIGNNSRLEDWGNRTACFWIGN